MRRPSLQRFQADHDGPSAADRIPSGRLSHRNGWIDREATKANTALGKVFPAMIAAMLIVIMLQVRSFSTMTMVMLTAPLGLVGVVPYCSPSTSPSDSTPFWA